MLDDYRKAQKRGLRQVDIDLSQGKSPYPLVLEDLLREQKTASEVYVGVCEIPLNLIVGTKTQGRQNVFSSDFLPIADEDSEFAAKWCSLYESQLDEGIREPIKAYEYYQRFYVQEGNKRVSVMRSVEAPTIPANVIRIMPFATDDARFRVYREFLDFFSVTGLYGIAFSEEGSYRRLAQYLGHDLDERWPEEDIRKLNAAFWKFTRAFEEAGSDIGLSPSDAFLAYVRLFVSNHPLETTQATFAKNIRLARSELAAIDSQAPIAFVEQPIVKHTPIVSTVKDLLVGRKPFKAAFIYDRNTRNSGWVRIHDEGRAGLEKLPDERIETSVFADCADDEAFDRAVDAAIADESDLIVTVSPRQIDQAVRAAVEHPDRTIINCSVNLSHRAVRTFHARMYEVKFVMGALAASLSDNHRLGYVANSPIYGDIAEVNAFALGAALVDSHATVHLTWLSTEGADWKRELADAQAHVIAGINYPDPAAPDEPYGLYLPDEGGRRVATPTWDWTRYYKLIIDAVRTGAWTSDERDLRGRPVNHWWGIAEGVIGLEFGDGLPLGTQRLGNLLMRAVREGTIHPFDGTLITQRGIVKNDVPASLTIDQIASMSWLDGNVEGRLPKSWEISAKSQGNVQVAGVVTPETDAEV